jgi:phytoene synthase
MRTRDGYAAGGYRHPTASSVLVERAAGDGEVSLAASYELCRRLHAAHGRTYYVATQLLPSAKRHHVHALYGFARYADDLVDHADLGWSPDERARALTEWGDRFLAGLTAGNTEEPVLKAAVHTVGELGVRHDDLRAFLRSMAMDLTVARYPTWADLAEYVYGSAAVIGSMMLPVLGADPARARRPAMELGVAFQLTNFLRDVAEDWDRGRIYLPLEDLERFGVTEWDFHARHVTPAFRRLLAFEASRTRALYRRAEDGWALLPPASQACIRTAHRLYAGILDRIEAHDYEVFRARASVPGWRKVGIATAELARASRSRRRGRELGERSAADPSDAHPADGGSLGRVQPWSPREVPSPASSSDSGASSELGSGLPEIEPSPSRLPQPDGGRKRTSAALYQS